MRSCKLKYEGATKKSYIWEGCPKSMRKIQRVYYYTNKTLHLCHPHYYATFPHSCIEIDALVQLFHKCINTLLEKPGVKLIVLQKYPREIPRLLVDDSMSHRIRKIEFHGHIPKFAVHEIVHQKVSSHRVTKHLIAGCVFMHNVLLQ